MPARLQTSGQNFYIPTKRGFFYCSLPLPSLASLTAVLLRPSYVFNERRRAVMRKQQPPRCWRLQKDIFVLPKDQTGTITNYLLQDEHLDMEVIAHQTSPIKDSPFTSRAELPSLTSLWLSPALRELPKRPPQSFISRPKCKRTCARQAKEHRCAQLSLAQRVLDAFQLQLSNRKIEKKGKKKKKAALSWEAGSVALLPSQGANLRSRADSRDKTWEPAALRATAFICLAIGLEFKSGVPARSCLGAVIASESISRLLHQTPSMRNCQKRIKVELES